MADQKASDVVIAKAVGVALAELKAKMDDAKTAGLVVNFWGEDGPWDEGADLGVEVLRDYEI